MTISAWQVKKWLNVLLMGVFGGCGGDLCTDLSCTPTQTFANNRVIDYSQRMAVAADGAAWLAWTEDAAGGGKVAIAARVEPSGKTTQWTVSTAPQDAAVLPQAVLSGSRPVIAWLEAQGGDQHVHVVSWNGAQWVTDHIQEPVSGTLVDVRMLVTSAQEVHLLWYEYGSTGGRAMSAKRAVDGTWSGPQVIRSATSVQDGPARLPDVAANQQGALLAVWSESAGAGLNSEILWSSRLDSGQSAWAPAVQIDAGDQYLARVSAGRQGEWVVAWHAGAPLARHGIWAKRCVNGVWDTAPQRVDAAGDEDPGEIAMVSADTSTYLAWSSNLVDASARATVRVAQFNANAGTWTTPVLLAGPSLSLPSELRFIQGADRRVALAWGTYTGPSGPWLAMTDELGVWRPAVSLDASGLGGAPDLAALPGSGWLVTWYQMQSNMPGTSNLMLRRVP